jgi:hypothetical protein
VFAVLVAAPALAHAERTQYGWLYGTEVQPERGAEIVSWIDEENDRQPGDLYWTRWGFSALVGVTDQLTIGLPLEFLWRDSAASDPSFTWQRYGLEARYRFVSQDPVDAPPFAPLARVAVYRDVTARDRVDVEADLVASTTTESGSVMALVDVGFAGKFGDDTHVELRPGAGISVRAVGDLRVGAEVYSELSLDSGGTKWAVVGPNVAWTHGRFWVSGAFGIGVYHIDTAPRVQWGIMF